VNIRKEPGHQSGGDQQSQGNETLMHQECIRFSAYIADDVPQVTKEQKAFTLCCEPATSVRARKDSRAATQQGRARTQNKVPV